MKDTFMTVSILVLCLIPIWGVLLERVHVIIQKFCYDEKFVIIHAPLLMVYLYVVTYALKFYGKQFHLSSDAIVKTFCYTGGFILILFGLLQFLTDVNEEAPISKYKKLLWAAAGVILIIIPILIYR